MKLYGMVATLLLGIAFAAPVASAQEASIYVCTDQAGEQGSKTGRIGPGVLQIWRTEGQKTGEAAGWDTNRCTRPTFTCSTKRGHFIFVEKDDRYGALFRHDFDPKTGKLIHFKSMLGKSHEDTYACVAAADPAEQSAQ